MPDEGVIWKGEVGTNGVMRLHGNGNVSHEDGWFDQAYIREVAIAIALELAELKAERIRPVARPTGFSD